MTSVHVEEHVCVIDCPTEPSSSDFSGGTFLRLAMSVKVNKCQNEDSGQRMLSS